FSLRIRWKWPAPASFRDSIGARAAVAPFATELAVKQLPSSSTIKSHLIGVPRRFVTRGATPETGFTSSLADVLQTRALMNCVGVRDFSQPSVSRWSSGELASDGLMRAQTVDRFGSFCISAGEANSGTTAVS